MRLRLCLRAGLREVGDGGVELGAQVADLRLFLGAVALVALVGGTELVLRRTHLQCGEKGRME